MLSMFLPALASQPIKSGGKSVLDSL